MTHLIASLRIRALGVAVRLVPAPTPFMLTGPGSSIELARLIADRGARSVLVVTDQVLVELEVVTPVLNALKAAGLAVTVFSEVEPDPTIDIVMAGIEQLRASGATAVLAVGGGSPIDAAKAMIACHASGRRPQDLDGYFKVRAPVVPFFAVPTTAGSGSEVTVGAVVSDPGAGRKFTIVDNKLVPKAIALDPNLMVGLPPHVTAATGMDALTHAIESNLSTLATPATRALSVAAARAIFRDLPRACEDGRDIAARQSLAVASCLAGLAITRASIGYVHAIAHQLGPLYHLPHGHLNAILLPYVLDFYVDGAASRLAELARACGLGRDGEDPRSLALSLVAAIRRLNASVGIPPTIEQIADADIPEIVRRALAEAHGTYPVPMYMSAADCATIVQRAAGRVMVAATDDRSRAPGARPEKEDI
ncbi:iron-containing alcohol dehydrogenase [uncultured Lamprocystis sp.]|jgi:alcohol dehydrogenase class IV|uniref:iron-containing alcohol dehydrogenase n=1 Tax=uncultured Lamprocystis sp. TaxID=543132 RepID=UPI0025F7075B|nr:iron-containing alcohol dehydrogenase [uncultured Lamprocystis sp.]